MPRIDRTTAILGLALAAGGALFVLMFWIMGAINLQRDFGLISELHMSGAWLTAFYAFPFVTFAAVAAGIIALLAEANEIAVGVAGLPIVGVVAYYFLLVHLHL